MQPYNILLSASRGISTTSKVSTDGSQPLTATDHIKHICTSLSCYMNYADSIVTRCIYCGDSTKRKYNYGHFSIWKHWPIATCWKCGTKVTLVQWLHDLRSNANSDVESSIRVLLQHLAAHKTLENMYAKSNSSSVYSSYADTDNSSNDNSSLSKFIELDLYDYYYDVSNFLLSRHLNADLIIRLVLAGKVNIGLWKHIDNDSLYIGTKSLLCSGINVRVISTGCSLPVTLKTYVKRSIHKDIFNVTTSMLAPYVVICEGLVDALSFIQMLVEDGYTFEHYAVVVSSVPEHPANAIRCLHYNMPKEILMVYDSDVPISTIKRHRSMLGYIARHQKGPTIYFKQVPATSSTIKKDLNDLLDKKDVVPYNNDPSLLEGVTNSTVQHKQHGISTLQTVCSLLNYSKKYFCSSATTGTAVRT